MKKDRTMRYVMTVMFILTGGAAAAHPGHLIEVAGHNHWVGGAAIGLAILAGLWGVLKGGDDAEEEIEEELEEEAA
jgi:hypothetical protein